MLPQHAASRVGGHVDVLLVRAARRTGADRAAIVRLSPAGDALEVVAATGDGAPVREGTLAAADAPAVAAAAETGRAISSPSGGFLPTEGVGGLFDGAVSWVVVPARARGVRAALALTWPDVPALDARARNGLLETGREIGRALEPPGREPGLAASLVADAAVALGVVDERLVLVHANAALEALASGRRAAVGRPLLDALPGLPPSLAADLASVIAGAPPRTIDATEVGPDRGGAQRRHWIATCFHVDVAGRAAHAGLALVDVSERVALEDARARRYQQERRSRQEREVQLAAEMEARRRLEASSRRRSQRLRLASRLARARTQAAVARIVLSELERALHPVGAWLWRREDDVLVALATTYGGGLRARFDRVPLAADLPLAESVRRGAPVVIAAPDEWRRWPGLADEATAAGIGTAVCVPLVVAGSVVGALAVDLPEGRVLDEDERALLLVLAAQAGQALDRARAADDLARHAGALEAALADARAAEARAATDADRLRALRAHAEALAAATDEADVARSTLRAVHEVAGASLDALLLLGRTPLGLAPAAGTPDAALLAAARRAATRRAPVATGRVLALPLVDGTLNGVLAVRGPGAAGGSAAVPLAVVAGQASAALERLRLRADEQRAHERAVAIARRFQASLVPAPQVSAPGVCVSARYVAGDDRMELGGDVLDACDVGGDVAFLIGDVAGHGPEAAALGSVLRAAWRGIVLDDADPAQSLARLDRVLASERRGADVFTTAIAGLYEPGRGRLALAVAGHPAPFIVDRRGARPLVVRTGPPIGVVGRATWVVTETRMRRGQSLVAYTDGVTEARLRPGRPDRFGEDRLRRALGRLGRDGPIGDAALAELVTSVRRSAAGGVDDDMALLALHRTA